MGYNFLLFFGIPVTMKCYFLKEISFNALCPYQGYFRPNLSQTFEKSFERSKPLQCVSKPLQLVSKPLQCLSMSIDGVYTHLVKLLQLLRFLYVFSQCCSFLSQLREEGISHRILVPPALHDWK